MKYDTIAGYVRTAHDIATAHGFHDEKKSDAHFLCLIVSELMEAVEADRKDRRADMMGFTQRVKIHPDFAERYEIYIKGSVEEEFADVVIRIFDLLGEKYPDGPDATDCLFDGENFPFGLGALDSMVTEPQKGFTFTEKAFYFMYFVLGPDKGQLIAGVQYMDAWAKQLGFDLDWHIRQKMAFNETRKKLHGKRY